MVQIYKAYEIPLAPDHAAAIMSLIEIMASMTCMCLVHFTGKRPLFLAMSLGTFLCSATLCLYGFILLPYGYVSFNQTYEVFHMENVSLTYIPLVALFLWSFCSYCGFFAMPWMLLSEIFPFK